MLSLLGLLGGLGLLIHLTRRGTDLLIAAPVCAALVAVVSGVVFFPQLGDPSFTAAYMRAFVDEASRTTRPSDGG